MNDQSINNIEVKKMNRNRIFKYIYYTSDVSKQNIADALNISLPTINQTLKMLREHELIIETGVFESTGGRKAKAMSISSSARYSVGIDITRNHIVAILIDLYGNVLSLKRVNKQFERNEEYFTYIGDLVETVMGEKLERSKVLGVGISLPSLLSADGKTITYSTVLDLTDGCLSDFEKYIPYKCLLSNDASAAGVAELWKQEEGMDNVVYLSLSSSVGGSILFDNKFYLGKNNRSAEFGHVTLFPDGKQCYCGQYGCVDVYLNSAVLTDASGGSLEEFFELVGKGDVSCSRIWKTYLHHLSIIVNSVHMALDCNVILGGSVGGYLEAHLDKLRELAVNLNSFVKDGEYLLACSYKTEASAVGAALQHVQHFIDSI